MRDPNRPADSDPCTPAERRRFVAQLARELGTTPAAVERSLREAIDAGLLIETPGGWQATFPPEEATR